MALTENKKIAIWPTAKAACRMLWAVRKQHVALAFMVGLPFAVMEVFGLNVRTNKILLLPLGLLWMTPLHILWQRLFLIGPDNFLKLTPNHFFRIWGQYIRCLLELFALFAGATALFIIMDFGVLHRALSITGPRITTITTTVFELSFIFLCLIAVMRVIPTLVSIPVEEDLPLGKSWGIMEGHGTRLLLTILPLSFSPIIISLIILGFLIFAISLIGNGDMVQSENPLYKVILTFLLSPLLFAGPALQLAAQAIIYRDLVPQPEHEVDVVV